ncbi:MAG: S8 family serine peptidase, partial [Anaerolineae bacterium]|nr:S8 family serine peptidase [Anaerolineae bacterium]
MRRYAWLILVLLVLTPATAYPQTPPTPPSAAPTGMTAQVGAGPTITEPPGAQVSARRVVVKLRAPLDAKGVAVGSSLASVNRQFGTQLTPLFYPAPRGPQALKLFLSMGMDRLYVATATSDIDTQAAARAFKLSAEVEDAEPDAVGEGGGGPPNDPYYGSLWQLPKINALGAWDISTGSPNLVVAIIDTGLWGWHPDLRYRVWYNPGEIPDNDIDDDGNGYVDDNWGWDFVNGDNVPQGDHWHGSHVGGIVGAEVNNGIGVAGLDQRARLMAVKVLDSQNRGNYTTWAQGVYYAVENGAQVLNMSLGGSVEGHLALQTAIDYAHSRGAVIVACMMNENSSTPFYPAAYASTIAVGATDRNDYRASPFDWGGGSNYGSHIDVVAPGNLIYSTGLNDSYLYGSGTSMAAPQVSALAALILAVAPNLSNEEVRQVIRQTARDGVGRPGEDLPGWDPYMGYGRIDAARALARAHELALPAPTPTVTPRPPTPTPTPPAVTPTPIAGCASPLVNGGFTGREGWTLNGRRSLISSTGRTGSSLFLGLLSGDTVESSTGDWASGRQTLTLPAEFTRLELSFWAYTAHTGGADTNDRFLARVLNAANATLVDVPLQVDSGAWREYRVDLTQTLAGQAGQPVTVYFAVKNVGGSGGNAYMRVDDAALMVCGAGAPSSQPSPTPTPSDTPTPTQTPPPCPYPVGASGYTFVWM